MCKRTKVQVFLVNIAVVCALILVVFPLLMNAGYNFPSADDWSYGAESYKVIKNGGNILSVLKAAFRTSVHSYISWEGRYCNSFFAALQPGIFGEKYYAIVPWMMIGMLIFSQVLLGSVIINWNKNINKWVVLPIVVPSLIMQILYTPSIVESFYWYTGAVNYTFVYGIFIVLISVFLILAFKDIRASYRVILTILSLILSIIVGGDNYATSLSAAVTFWLFSAFFLIWKRKAIIHTWFITIVTTAGLILCIISPGNQNRINANFGGNVGNPVEAVFMSFVKAFTCIRLWTGSKIIIMILILLPFIWFAVKNIKCEFKYPGLFTILSFGIYSSQFTATVYVDGTVGGGRMAAILYYSYHLLLLLNIGWWIGWIRSSKGRIHIVDDKIGNIISKFFEKAAVMYCAVLGIVLIALIYKTDLKDISSYKAYRDYKQGWAARYAAEWEDRFKILHDDNVKDVVFKPLSVQPDTILYTDLQDEYGYTWVNSACAVYYGKDSITVLEQ